MLLCHKEQPFLKRKASPAQQIKIFLIIQLLHEFPPFPDNACYQDCSLGEA